MIGLEKERIEERERWKRLAAAFYERASGKGLRCRSNSPGGEKQCELPRHHEGQHTARRRANSITAPGNKITWEGQ